MSSVLALLRGLGGWAIKHHGSAFSTVGTPDVLGCVAGRSVVVEVKRPGERPTAAQVAQLAKWRRAGAVALVATSADEVRAALVEAGVIGR